MDRNRESYKSIMDKLLQLSLAAVRSCRKLRELRRLHENVEGRAQLGAPAEACGASLSSIIIARIPKKLSLIVTRELKDEDDWKVGRLLK